MSSKSWVVLALSLTAGACGHHTATIYTPPDMSTSGCAHCGAPGLCCNNKCIDVTGDRSNCGACGHVCGDGDGCVGGACLCAGMSACAGAQSCCGQSGCKSLMDDTQNCGVCGHACGDGETCTAGQCAAAAGCMGCANTCCNAQCTDTSSDSSNCGACGTACTQGQSCVNSSCMDPAMMGGGSDGGACGCVKKCLIPLPCQGGCCVEDVFLKKCTPDPKCSGTD